MGKQRTYSEINEKIKKKEAVVVTAEELLGIVAEKGVSEATKAVDVITTGTFGPMCSSGVLFNIGHNNPKFKANKIWINDVEAYAGLAAVDCFLGATKVPESDPKNSVFPGHFNYGGGHIITELLQGKTVTLKGQGYGTNCYPQKEIEKKYTLKDFKDAWLLNPRNAYQNYNIAVNASNKTRYTYLGVLKPNFGNANYCSAGQLSPLLVDPFYRTIGLGTRIFLGGTQGWIIGPGTQHAPNTPRDENGIPKGGAGTIAVRGDLKKMSPEYIRGVSFIGYGASLAVGIGVPIPVLNEEIVKYASLGDKKLKAPIVDYANDYPECTGKVLGYASYAELKSGKISFNGKEIPTASISSYSKAQKIANELKSWIQNGVFTLGEPQELLSDSI